MVSHEERLQLGKIAAPGACSLPSLEASQQLVGNRNDPEALPYVWVCPLRRDLVYRPALKDCVCIDTTHAKGACT